MDRRCRRYAILAGYGGSPVHWYWLDCGKRMSVKDYQSRVRDLGCILCLELGLGKTPAAIHHVESIRDGLSEYAVVPLCHTHHQGEYGVHGLSRRGFEAMYKLTEIDLLAMVARALES